MTALSAVIFIAEEERHNPVLISQGLNHIATQGHRFDSIVSDWEQLLQMLHDKLVQVVVYTRPEHIDPTWLPRFELAGAGNGEPVGAAPQEAQSAPVRPPRRRPRLLKS